MKNILSLPTSLLILCASVCTTGAYAEDQIKPAQAQMQIQTPQQFIRGALTDGQKEIRLGELALQKSDDPQVKTFATQLVQDHSKANMELKEIAQRKGFDVPAEDYDTANIPVRAAGDESAPNTPAVGSDDRPQDTSKRVKDDTEKTIADDQKSPGYRKLEGLSGVEFDRTWTKMMVDDHKKAVAVFESAARNLSDSELKAFASQTLPTLRMHLEQAQKLDRQYTSGRDDVTLVK